MQKNADQRLPGCRPKGRFTVKMEPEEDEMQVEIPEIPENSCSDFDAGSESVFGHDSKFGAEICQPFIVTRSKKVVTAGFRGAFFAKFIKNADVGPLINYVTKKA